jgi:CHAD domain-containing protein
MFIVRFSLFVLRSSFPLLSVWQYTVINTNVRASSMPGGKWIEGLTATTATVDAARRVLTVRLEVVRDELPPAVRESEADPEHVHQLRVATRRARAALDIFACCLPSKVYRAAKKQLRDVRRAAGEARDWDVFLVNLAAPEQRQNRRWSAGLDFLLGYGLARRAAAQDELCRVAGEGAFAFDRFVTDTVAEVHAPHQPEQRTLIGLARPQLTTLVVALDEAAAKDLDNYDHLHQVRIHGKRLRYAMEVFADCFAPAFREELYPTVEDMQEILGNANDSHVATGRLEKLREMIRARLASQWPRLQPGLTGLLHYHRERLPRERERFRDWWEKWLQTGAVRLLALLNLTVHSVG